jgi:hypothetical protein
MNHKLMFLITTSKVIKDQYTGLMSYIDVFSSLTIPKDSSSIANSFVVMGRITNNESKIFNGEIRILDSNRKLIANSVLSGQVEPGDVDLTGRFDLIKFENVGRYYLRLVINGEEIKDDDNFYFDVLKGV